MIRTIPVAPEMLGLVAAGQPEAVMVWEDVAGRRTLTDRQEHDDQGLPVWNCYLMPTAAERPEVLQVRVSARQQPVLPLFGAVAVDGLEVNVRKNKSGDLVGYWQAGDVRDAGQSGRKNGQEHKQHEGQPA